MTVSVLPEVVSPADVRAHVDMVGSARGRVRRSRRDQRQASRPGAAQQRAAPSGPPPFRFERTGHGQPHRNENTRVSDASSRGPGLGVFGRAGVIGVAP